MVLSRQNLPVLQPDPGVPSDAAQLGGYVFREAASGDPEVILLATGSELQVALAGQELLQADGIATRVVSMPCLEWFHAQSQEYRDSVLPPAVRARVSVEAGSDLGWWKYVGDAGQCVAIDHFGASAAGEVLFEEFGFTAKKVAEAARLSLARVAALV